MSEEEMRLPTRGVFTVKLDGRKKQELFAQKFSITIFEDKNLTKEFIRVDTEGVFKKNEKLAFLRTDEKSSMFYYKTVNSSDEDDGDLLHADLIFFNTDEGTVSPLMIPFDERLAGDIFKINYRGKSYYLKATPGLKVTVYDKNKENREEFVKKYWDRLSTDLGPAMECYKKNDLNCIKKIKSLSDDISSSNFGDSLKDLKLNFDGNLDIVLKEFMQPDKLVYRMMRPDNKDQGQFDSACLYRFDDGEILDENNYEHLKKFYSDLHENRKGACAKFYYRNNELRSYSFSGVYYSLD